VGAEVLLEVKVSDNNVSWWLEQILELFVKNELATVIWVLETLFGDVLVDELGHFGTRDQFTFGKSQEFTQLRCHFLLTVETVVGSASLGLFAIWILLGALDLTDELGEGLDVGAESGNFSLDSFKRHLIPCIAS